MPRTTGSQKRPALSAPSPDPESDVIVEGAGCTRDARSKPADRDLRAIRQDLERARFERDRAVAALRAFEATMPTLDSLEARGLAHDLRNLLQAILGHGMRVSSLIGAVPEAQEHLQMVQRAAERAATLTERLVSPRPPDARPNRCDANAVLGELADLLLPCAPKGVAFERAFDPELPPLAIAEDDLRQIALNLMVNAWQALNERGGHVRLLTQRARDRGVVEVSDDGDGMDESVLERIFEPFFSTRSGGRGLGLATVQTLLRRAGGDVRVSSRPGRGTSFVVGLPLAEDAEA